MRLSRTSMRVGFISFLIIFAISTIAYVWYQARIQSQLKMHAVYDKFSLEEKKTIPKFDTLNEEVAKSLPILPPSSSVTRSGTTGIIAPLYEHGRWLSIEISTTQRPEFILYYYTSFFVNADWLKNLTSHAFNDLFYYKGTSCIEISPPSDVYHYYEIYIWHDYRNQSFSPEIPDHEIMSRFEMGLTDIATCP